MKVVGRHSGPTGMSPDVVGGYQRVVPIEGSVFDSFRLDGGGELLHLHRELETFLERWDPTWGVGVSTTGNRTSRRKSKIELSMTGLRRRASAMAAAMTFYRSRWRRSR